MFVQKNPVFSWSQNTISNVRPRRTPDLLNDFDSNGEYKLMGNAIAIPVINFGTKGEASGLKAPLLRSV